MRYVPFFIFLGALGVGSVAQPFPAQAEQDFTKIPQAETVDEAHGVVKIFAGKLGGALMAAIEKDGVDAGIAVCHEKAPEIAAEVSAESGWEIGRTSLKARNPDNVPNEWESMVLEQFEGRKDAGEDIATLEYIEFTPDMIHYMKAIPTGEMCVMCHGKDIAPEIQAKLDKYYPDDEATGFEVGDIRGAFTLSKKAPE